MRWGAGMNPTFGGPGALLQNGSMGNPNLAAQMAAALQTGGNPYWGGGGGPLPASLLNTGRASRVSDPASPGPTAASPPTSGDRAAARSPRSSALGAAVAAQGAELANTHSESGGVSDTCRHVTGGEGRDARGCEQSGGDGREDGRAKGTAARKSAVQGGRCGVGAGPPVGLGAVDYHSLLQLPSSLAPFGMLQMPAHANQMTEQDMRFVMGCAGWPLEVWIRLFQALSGSQGP